MTPAIADPGQVSKRIVQVCEQNPGKVNASKFVQWKTQFFFKKKKTLSLPLLFTEGGVLSAKC